MKALRITATALAAVLCALGLSVAAALAEGPSDPAAPTGSEAPAGLCFLHDL
jgi:hypothetical protein